MKKKPTVSQLKKKLWTLFSEYIRLRDSLAMGSFTHATCCTCGKVYPSFGKGCLQAGHYIPGRHNSYLFEEQGCHAQCYNCNINMKGNPIPYRRFMIETYGEERTKEIEELYYQKKQFKPYELEEMIEVCKAKLSDLKQSEKYLPF